MPNKSYCPKGDTLSHVTKYIHKTTLNLGSTLAYVLQKLKIHTTEKKKVNRKIIETSITTQPQKVLSNSLRKT